MNTTTTTTDSHTARVAATDAARAFGRRFAAEHLTRAELTALCGFAPSTLHHLDVERELAAGNALAVLALEQHAKTLQAGLGKKPLTGPRGPELAQAFLAGVRDHQAAVLNGYTEHPA